MEAKLILKASGGQLLVSKCVITSAVEVEHTPFFVRTFIASSLSFKISVVRSAHPEIGDQVSKVIEKG